MNSKFDWMIHEENKKTLILLRGLPSSGKSFLAKQLCQGDESIICSADHFFGMTPEEYVVNWSVEKLGTAHKQCQFKVKTLLQNQVPLVIVDNTNTMVREIMPYFEMAFQYQYRFEIKEPISPWWVNDIAPYLKDKVLYEKELKKAANILFEKNQETHKVPLQSIQKMLDRYHVDVTFEQLANELLKTNL